MLVDVYSPKPFSFESELYVCLNNTFFIGKIEYIWENNCFFLWGCWSQTTVSESGGGGETPARVQLRWKYFPSLVDGIAVCADYRAGRKTVLLTAQVSVVSSDRNCLKSSNAPTIYLSAPHFKANMPLGASCLTLTEHEHWAWQWQLLCTLHQAQGREYSCHIRLMSKINAFTTNFSHYLLCSYKSMWDSVWVLYWGQEWLRKRENKSCLFVGLSYSISSN